MRPFLYHLKTYLTAPRYVPLADQLIRLGYPLYTPLSPSQWRISYLFMAWAALAGLAGVWDMILTCTGP